MTKYGMLVNVDNCTGCYNCTIACKDEHVGNSFLPWSEAQPESGHNWIRVEAREGGAGSKVTLSHVPVPCQQCEDAPCIAAAEDNAVYRRDDGIVVIDPKRAAGQRQLVDSCPYGAIAWNDELDIPQKCTFCSHLLEQGWSEPRCVEACPADALVFGDIEDPSSRLSQMINSTPTEELLPEQAVTPLVRYVGLPKLAITGEIVLGDSPNECGVGVKITLICDREEQTQVTDCFGDFKFSGLQPGVEYTILAELDGYEAVRKTTVLNGDQNIESIVLPAL